MSFQIGHTPAHKGKRTTTTPIKEYSKVQDVKAKLRDDKRALALFTLGCNTALRAGDMLRLTRDQLTLQDDGRYEIATVERKTQKRRLIILNGPTSRILHEYLQRSSGTYVFEGQRGKMSVSYLRRLIKKWCADAGVDGHIATHTMRKSFVRLNYEHFGAPLAVLMRALGHSSEKQTLDYVGMLPKDIERLYENSI
jgi:integrase